MSEKILVRFTGTFPEALAKKIEEAAAKEDRSKNNFVTRVLEKHFEERGKSNKIISGDVFIKDFIPTNYLNKERRSLISLSIVPIR